MKLEVAGAHASMILSRKPGSLDPNYTEGLRVIGAGLARTGTSSLKTALEALYGAPCYHMTEVFGHDHLVFWTKAAKNQVSTAEFHNHFKNYAGTVDNPACMHWEDLMRAFPDAKVILTVRKPEAWFKSFESTVLKLQPGYSNQPIGIWILYKVLPFWKRSAEFLKAAMVEKLMHNEFSKQSLICRYEAHNADVLGRCPKDKLLLFDVSEGWEPLCKFLELPVPEGPFPRVNDHNQMRVFLGAANLLGWAIVLVPLAAAVATATYLFSSV